MRAIKRAFSSKATERGWKLQHKAQEREGLFFFFDAPPSFAGRKLSVFESLRKSSKVFETELLNLFLPRKKKIFLDGKLHNKRERKA